jgi:hypothetical protein
MTLSRSLDRSSMTTIKTRPGAGDRSGWKGLAADLFPDPRHSAKDDYKFPERS